MAATWPLAPRSAALLNGTADTALLISRQIPWISGNDPVVDELLLSLNDGGSSACSLAATNAHILAAAAKENPHDGCSQQASASNAPACPQKAAAQRGAPMRTARSKASAKAKAPAAQRRTSGRPLWRNVGQEQARQERSTDKNAAPARQQRQRSGSPQVFPLPDLAEIRQVLEDAVATSRISSQPPSSLERTRLTTNSTLQVEQPDDPQLLSQQQQRRRQEVDDQGPMRSGQGARLRPPRLPAALSTRLNRIAQHSERFSPARRQPDSIQMLLPSGQLPDAGHEETEGAASSSAAAPPSQIHHAQGSTQRLGHTQAQLPDTEICDDGTHDDLQQQRFRNHQKLASSRPEGGSPTGPHAQVALDPRQVPEESCLGPPLRCHMLFSSPLCLERPVVVHLPCNFLRHGCNTCSSTAEAFSSTADAEVAAWNLEFEPSCPAVVRSMQAGGLIANWNAQQEHAESMVRPGDTLIRVSMSGVQELVRGRRPADALAGLLSRVGLDGHGPTPSLELVFCALRALQALRVGDEVEVIRSSGCEVIARGATAQNIRGLIAAADCHILHLSLHCSVAQEQLLFLEDPHGKAHVIRAGDLKGLLLQGQQRQTIGLVVVSACHSLALGAHFVDAGVRHVVCVRSDREVRDESCRLFARDFFHALRAGRSVQEAFECGTAVLDCSNQPHHRHDAGSFVLLPEDGDHSETFACPGGAKPVVQACIEGGTWGSLLPLVEDFQGREADMHKLLLQLHNRRFIEVQGEGGSGKTAFLTAVGRFLALRCDLFDEVRWIETAEKISFTYEECNAGLEGLRHRLTYASPTRRVLLLVDDAKIFRWASIQPLLRFGGVHVVLASLPGSPAPESDISAGVDLVRTAELASRTAVAAGLKPVIFKLGPLEPMAQIKLFLHRAARPLYMCELQGQLPPAAQMERGELPVLQPPRRPVEYLQLAAMPLFADLHGNPKRIVDAAVQLAFVTGEPSSPSQSTRANPLAEDGNAVVRTLSADSSAGPREKLSIAGTRRRVRLVRPDGKTKDEWLPRRASVLKIMEEYSPQALRSEAEIFIAGCRAPPEALIADFPDDEVSGLLILEFRRREEDVW